MAIDFGTKRVGIAVTDANNIIASALTTIHSKDVLDFLKEYTSREIIEMIVIGEPRRMNNQASDVEMQIIPFVKSLRAAFPAIPIERMDERFTSKIAFQTMIDGGLKKKARQNKDVVDRISATIILQSFMEFKLNKSGR